MFREKVPGDVQFEPVVVADSSGHQFQGRAAVKKWSEKEAFWRGFRKSAKVVGIAIGIILPFAVLEPFAFMIWGSVFIGGAVLVLGPFLHIRSMSETATFYYVESECPYCHVETKLTPYLSTAFSDEFTVLCPSCGQASKARRENE